MIFPIYKRESTQKIRCNFDKGPAVMLTVDVSFFDYVDIQSVAKNFEILAST